MTALRMKYIVLALAVLLIVCSVTAIPDIKKSSRYADRATIMSQVLDSKSSSPWAKELENYREMTANAGPSNISISLVITTDPSQYCSTCGTGWVYTQPTYRFRYTYPIPPSVPTYYPGPSYSTERGYGSLIVTGPDDGNSYYLWIKSKFYAADIAPGYNMQWQPGGTLPVAYQDTTAQLLEGSYCLKVTTVYNSTAQAVWCGSAVIAANQTTTIWVNPTFCPFGCSCI